MEISRSLMDLFFGYNGRVGDVKGTKEGIAEFEQRAKTASTPEERARYAQAAKQLRTEILPQMQKEMEQLGKQLGLSSGDIGKVIKKDAEDLPELALKQQKSGVLSAITSYEKGSYYYNKT
ncbi:hypothetical protein ACSLBF_04270 [Pseudoalteromonas sp. T1lg65]|uniref:hypothetical protein n=1 Tax=Pseudoalteromonas sp. T1lg65 TaxID=2077101 RepID=UPI003F795FC3